MTEKDVMQGFQLSSIERESPAWTLFILFISIFYFYLIRPKKKLLYWSNPPDPNFTPYPRHFYLFFFFLRRKNKNKSIIMDIKVGKPQNMQLYVRRKVKMFRSPILLCGYGLCVQV